jgi:hypothetical protein
MRHTPHRILGHLLVLGVLGVVGPALPGLVTASADQPAVTDRVDGSAGIDGRAAPLPPDMERIVASDMVVDWVDGAPSGLEEALLASPAPADHRAPAAGAEGVEHTAAISEVDDGTDHHAAAGGGYALFSDTARWLPSGYTIRLTGGDGRIEQFREEIHAAASSAALLTGVPFHVATSFGGPADPSRGEIAVVLDSGPCGADAVGCGGPTLTQQEVLAGRVWLDPTSLGLSVTHQASLAAHELGHALGLQHYDGSWTDGRQVMFPRLSEVTSYRSGDGAGLRFVAGSADRPAGSLASLTYAAGRAHVAGNLAAGSRIRLSAGSAAVDVAASGGNFVGELPLGRGSHVVCATALDAGPGFRRNLGCAPLKAPGKPMGRLGGVTGSFETIRIRGWAIDPQTADAVQVQVRRNGELVATVPADQPRGDLGGLATHYGTAHGIDVEVPATAGRNRMCVRIVGVGAGGDLDIGCADVVHAVDPVGALDGVRVDALGVRVDGWALDPNTPESISVVVHVDGNVTPIVGTATASGERPDVAAQHPGHGSKHGFSHWVPLTPGPHQVCVTAVNVGLGSDRPLGCADVVYPLITRAGDLITRVGDVLALS